MGRNTEYQFVPTDPGPLEAQLVAGYEKITGVSVKPASPEKLFIQWVTSIVLHERVLNNYTGNQNLPSGADGENLDKLGDLFFAGRRPEAKAAVCTMRFYISEAQAGAVLIPSKTRVTDASNTLVWETAADIYVPAGATSVDIKVKCQTTGIVGNGYAVGQINTAIDLFDYYDHCENISVSDDGADRASDEEYYELMRASMDGYSSAGAKGGYVYFAKRVSTEIADVVANRPADGRVALYVLMDDGTIAGEEMKAAVLAACSDEIVRPLTDFVSAADPELVKYDIAFTYYIPSATTASSAEIQAAVSEAVKKYVQWQNGKLGRDINPDELRKYLYATGIKRIELTSPSFTVLRDGKDNTVPQVAAVDTITATNGGHEDE